VNIEWLNDYIIHGRLDGEIGSTFSILRENRSDPHKLENLERHKIEARVRSEFEIPQNGHFTFDRRVLDQFRSHITFGIFPRMVITEDFVDEKKRILM
jgi:hypothetical protein